MTLRRLIGQRVFGRVCGRSSLRSGAILYLTIVTVVLSCGDSTRHRATSSTPTAASSSTTGSTTTESVRTSTTATSIQMQGSSVTTGSTRPPPVTTIAAPRSAGRVIWPPREVVPQRILDVLDDDMWLYGYAQLDDSTVFIGTARGSDFTMAYRCTAELFRVDLTTGSRTKIADAVKPTLTPDHRRVAFAARRTSPETTVCGLDVITLLDLDTNSVQSAQPVGPSDLPAAAFALQWSPDGTKLRFYIGYEHSDGVSSPLTYDPSDNTVVSARIDETTAQTLSDTYAPTMTARSWSIWIGVWLAPNTLAVRVSCGLGCLAELPRDQQPGWYALPADGVLRTLDHRITDPAVIADLDRCIGLTYC